MLSQLNEQEKIALVGVLKWIVSADPQDSLEGMTDFFQDNHFGDFNTYYQEMDNKFEDVEALQSFLKTIDDSNTHQLIIKVAKDIALSDVMITHREKKVFKFLQEIWGIDPATV
ncbi:MAG: hypothetical protein MJB14_15730 [Spirochaetes bacterium]|nr:hypothetical protein [Spirochaetota bacterium]